MKTNNVHDSSLGTPALEQDEDTLIERVEKSQWFKDVLSQNNKRCGCEPLQVPLPGIFEEIRAWWLRMKGRKGNNDIK